MAAANKGKRMFVPHARHVRNMKRCSLSNVFKQYRSSSDLNGDYGVVGKARWAHLSTIHHIDSEPLGEGFVCDEC